MWRTLGMVWLPVYWRRKLIINITQLEPLQTTTVTFLQDILVQSGINVVGATNHYFLKAHSTR